MPALRQLLIVFCFVYYVVCATNCTERGHQDKQFTPILLFNGDGTSPNDVAAVEAIMDNIHLSYRTVNSSEINAMSALQLKAYRLLVVPGGDFIKMGNSIKKPAANKIREAVLHGLNYMGICAGGFLAGYSAYYNAFNLTSGTTFGFYAAEYRGIRKAVIPITGPNGQTLEQYWQDGPQLTGWGETVANYPDDTPAVVQGKCGKGFVILTGMHAEAPASWRRGIIFKTPVAADNSYAAMIISAALNATPLPHY